MSEEKSYYNLLVVGDMEAWEKEEYTFSFSRFLEYTKDTTKNELDLTSLESIYSLREYPTIFAYESDSAYIGKLTKIQIKKGEIFITYEIDSKANPLDFKEIAELDALNIHDFEVNRTHWAVKSANLKKVLESEGYDISPYSSLHLNQNSLANKNKPQTQQQESRTNLAGIIKKLLEFKKQPDYDIYYRGQSKAEYVLEPGIFRKDNEGVHLHYHNEERLYKEILVSNSHDFVEDVCTFDRLVRMQHYSLPTRLLDITSNPLVALYFACCSNKDSDGKLFSIHVKKNQTKYYDSDSVSCIANLALLSKNSKERIFSKVKSLVKFKGNNCTEQNNKIEDLTEVKRLYHFIKAEKPFFQESIVFEDFQKIFCVKAKKNNNRIQYQSGAFLLFGIESTLFESENFTEGDDIIATAIIIPAELKEAILIDLDVLNINQATIFQHIEFSAKYITEKLGTI